MTARTAPAYFGTSMAARVLDLVRLRLRKRSGAISGAEVFDEIRSAAVDVDARDEELFIALSYTVLAIKDGRALYDDKLWPRSAHDAWIALTNASDMAETCEKGCVFNVTA